MKIKGHTKSIVQAQLRLFKGVQAAHGSNAHNMNRASQNYPSVPEVILLPSRFSTVLTLQRFCGFKVNRHCCIVVCCNLATSTEYCTRCGVRCGYMLDSIPVTSGLYS